ncbi:MAG: ABC transporter ATP-binding protein [Succiniclasticum sp.]|jgi:ABC-type glutathione transport system ATPase component|nr:ABC transporter ATP-binding protein [Succiniclasticum sp.]MEE3479123.1 ABC transporter ATP-binding protein [Succiniclasticum sp.]
MEREIFMEARNLQYFYGDRQVLFDMDCQFRRRTVLGIAGASGSGKTTFLNAVAGMLPDGVRITGELRYQGVNLLQDRQKHRALRGTAIAMVPQNPAESLYPLHTIGAQFRFMAESRGRQAQWREMALEALRSLNMDDAERILDRYPFELSGGQNQRVCLAMSLLQQPELLLMDEPTSGLDVAAQNRVLDALAAFRARCDASIVLISHNLGFLAKTCDCLLVLKDGRTVEQGEVKEVLAHPRTEYTRRLLAAVPRLSALEGTGEGRELP